MSPTGAAMWREEDEMSDVPFYRTQMGHRYYEHTLPELVRQLGRVADQLERLRVQRSTDDPCAAPASEPDPSASAPAR